MTPVQQLRSRARRSSIHARLSRVRLALATWLRPVDPDVGLGLARTW